MKVQNVAVDEIQRTGLGTDQAFTIKFDAKMARILADGLYSDKVQSVIRELSCNAWDSHVQAGRADRAFDVHLPNTIEPWFSIRDYGVGLTHAEVISIYTCYGASTKTNSNDVIGQLGLGSKSPFSLCNAFDVSSRHDGVENHYSMYKDELGMPSVAHLGSRATTEPNGVTVKVPVGADQRREFVDKAREVYKWFPVKPRVLGTEVKFDKIEYEYTGRGWSIRKANKDSYGYNTFARPVALMGMVAYPLDKNAISNTTAVQRIVLDLPLVLEFDIGDLEVAANREALGYDERTCNNIKNKIDNLIAELGSHFEKEIATAPTLWQARSKFDKIFGYHNGYNRAYRDIFAAQGLKWNTTVVNSSNTKLDTEKLYGTSVVTGYIYNFTERYKSGRRPTELTFMVDCTENTVIMFDDVGHGGVSRAKTYHRNNNHEKTIFLFKQTDTAQWSDILEALGNPEVIYTSSLPKPVRQMSDRTNTLRWRETQLESSPRGWEQVSIDLEEGGYYVDLRGWDIHALGDTHTDLGWMVKQARAAGIIENDAKIYAMRGPNKKVINDNTDWVELYSYIKNEVEQRVKTQNLAQNVADSEEFRRTQSKCSWDFWKYTDQYANTGGLMYKFSSEMSEICQFVNALSHKNEALRALAIKLQIDIGAATPRYKLFDQLASVMKTYPMIGFRGSSWQRPESHDLRSAIEYVNYIDITRPFYDLTMSEQA